MKENMRGNKVKACNEPHHAIFWQDGFCPICAAKELYIKSAENIKESFMGTSPSPFVGRYGYPNINLGILTTTSPSDEDIYDSPRKWAELNYGFRELINIRGGLVNPRRKASVFDARKRTKLIDVAQEVALSSAPADVEVELKRKPRPVISLNSVTAPLSPSAPLKRVRLATNPRVKQKVEKVVSDDEMKAVDGALGLYRAGFDETFITRLISTGLLGMRKNRKLVPTRYSITATDDMLAKAIIKGVIDYEECGFYAYSGGYLGNFYLFITLPGPWGFELFETYAPTNKAKKSYGNKFTTDYEMFAPRKNYAENCTGGYYSVRLAVAEKMRALKRRGMVLAIRVVEDYYAIPLGVWVTREAARKALNNKPIEFSDRELLLRYARYLLMKRFSLDTAEIEKKSVLLGFSKEQKSLADFI